MGRASLIMDGHHEHHCDEATIIKAGDAQFVDYTLDSGRTDEECLTPKSRQRKMSEDERARIEARIAEEQKKLEADKKVIEHHGDKQVVTLTLPGKWNAMDVNKEGVIDKCEWQAAGRSEKDFNRLDVNGDGVLDAHELGQEHVRKEIAARAEDDGRIDLAEFMAAGGTAEEFKKLDLDG